MSENPHRRQHGDMSLSTAWGSAVESYLSAQRSAGTPATTLATRRQHLHNLARGVDAGPWDLTADQLVDFTGSRSWMPETRRSRRTTFLSFWRWAIDTGRTSTNPAAALIRVKASAPNPRPVPDDVWDRAWARARPRERLMMRLAADAGLRRAEIAVIHSRDVFQDLDGWSLRVHGKGGKLRDQTLTRRLAFDLRALPAGYAFPGDVDGHLSPRRVGELVNAVLEDDWTIHKLRTRGGQRVYDESGDLAVTQDFLGHASPATTRHYVRPSRARLRAIADAAAY